ncbi:ABC transporter ATP-binding protein uup [Methylibium sp. T29-B]|nr:ABC transporter ATP-binding protein uup [Methylibium sp. T29-B]
MAAPAPVAAAPVKRAKLSFKEQRELDALPARIEALEAEQRTLGEQLGGTALYAEAPQRVAEVQARYARIEEELMAALERWEVLGSR